MNHYFMCMLLSVTVASVSQILLKKSAGRQYDSVIKEYMNLWVVGGYALLLLSMLLTLYSYSGLEYKNGPVIESLGNVLVMVLSYFVFGEKISLRKLIGLLCIMGGIAVFYA